MNDKLFIKLSKGKKPLEKWGTDDYRYTLKQVQDSNHPNGWAFVPPEGYCVIDTDTEDATKVMADTIERLNITPVSWATTRGRHYLFKVSDYDTPIKPTSLCGAKHNALGLHDVDYKGFNRGYVKIHGRIDPALLIKIINDNGVPELPLMLYPIRIPMGANDNESKLLNIRHYPAGERNEIMIKDWIVKLRKFFANDKDLVKKFIGNVVMKYHKDNNSDIIGWITKNVDWSFQRGDIEFKGSVEEDGAKSIKAVINKYSLVSYNNNIFYRDDRTNVWETIENMPNDTYKTAFFNAMLKQAGIKRGSHINMASVVGDVLLHNKVTERFNGMCFTNGYVGKDGFVETQDIPFTTTQIPRAYDPKAKPTKLMQKYLKSISGGDLEIAKGLLQVWATCLDGKNHEMFTVLYSGGGETGKSTFWKLMSKFVGKENSEQVKSSSILGSNTYTFALRGIKNKTVVGVDELPLQLSKHSGEMIKLITNTGTLNYDSKNSNESSIDSTMTWVATTNHIPTFYNLDKPLIGRLLFFEIPESNLTEKDWKDLYDNAVEHMTSMLPSLVKIYIELMEATGSRAGKFSGNKVETLVEVAKEGDELFLWIEKRADSLTGMTAGEIFKEYKKAVYEGDININIKSAQSITSKLPNMGWTQKRTAGRREWKKPLTEKEAALKNQIILDMTGDN